MEFLLNQLMMICSTGLFYCENFVFILCNREVRLSDFDKDTCKDFNNDLKAYSKISKGQDYISLDVKFPPNYPYEPPFIRVVKPRFKFRTGHVTIGGSICMELLTPAGWRPIYTLEAVLIQIKTEMSLGGARLDLSNTAPYTEREAMDAFYRGLWEKMIF